MKRRMVSVLLCVTLVVTLLTGCMRMEEAFVVNADGSASLSAEVLFAKQDMLDIMENLAQETGESFSEQETTDNLLAGGYQLVTKDGKEYFSYTDESENKSYSSLKELYRNEESGFASVIRPENDQSDYVCLTETSFEAAFPEDMMNSDVLFADSEESVASEAASFTKEWLKNSELCLSVTFATPVVKASEGAELSEDKKTVSFTLPFLGDGARKIYAYCENDIVLDGVNSGFIYGKTVSYTIPEGVTATLNGTSVQGEVISEASGTYDLTLKASDGTQKSIYYEIDKDAPVIQNIKNNGVYSIKTTIQISDAQTGIDSVKLDGKDIFEKLEATLSETSDSGLVSYLYKLSSLKETKHTLTVSDKLGNTSSVTFTVDKTAPTVTGVKNNKTYKKAVTIKVKDKNGVKSITLNGKKIKSGKKVSKKGSYKLVVKDIAGNTKTVRFKIKK